MGRDRAAALTAFAQLSRMPAVCRFARAQAHLRGFAFWNSHGEAGRKARSCEKTTAWRPVVMKKSERPDRFRFRGRDETVTIVLIFRQGFGHRPCTANITNSLTKGIDAQDDKESGHESQAREAWR